MAKTIKQTVTFRVPPERLFNTYTDSAKHAAAIGSTASVSRRVGGPFRAFRGALRGRTLAVVPRRMIVQSWRGSDWRKTDLDSILILTFRRVRGGGQITLVHANVPDRQYAGIRKGWKAYYWDRWRAYFKRGARRRRGR